MRPAGTTPDGCGPDPREVGSPARRPGGAAPFFRRHATEILALWAEAPAEGNGVPPDYAVDGITPLLASLLDHLAAGSPGPDGDASLWEHLRAFRELPLSGILAILHRGKAACFDLVTRDDAPANPDGLLAISQAFDDLTARLLRRFERENEERSSLDCRITPELFSRLSLLNSAFKHSTDGIIITDTAGVVVDVNEAFLRLFGYRKDDVVGRRTAILRSRHTSDDFYRAMWASIRATGEWKGEVVNRARDGSEIPVWLSITPIYHRGEVIGYLGIEIDMRERKRLEGEILKGERMAMIGQMAAKVAHEIHNPLASMTLNAELLEDEIAAMSRNGGGMEARALLRAVSADIDRISDLLGEYLTFSRLPRVLRSRGDLAAFLETVLDDLRPLAEASGVAIHLERPEGPVEMDFDPRQLRRVAVNLTRNAFDAMADGGRLAVTLADEDDGVTLAFRDTGPGIDRDIRERLFEPFVTTRSNGTGLGLAIVQQIVREHGGAIACESPSGAGATFTIRLPRTGAFSGKDGK